MSVREEGRRLVLLHPIERRGHDRRRDVEQVDGDAGIGEMRGDAAAHGSRSDDDDALDHLAVSLLSGAPRDLAGRAAASSRRHLSGKKGTSSIMMEDGPHPAFGHPLPLSRARALRS